MVISWIFVFFFVIITDGQIGEYVSKYVSDRRLLLFVGVVRFPLPDCLSPSLLFINKFLSLTLLTQTPEQIQWSRPTDMG